ncbi:MAG: glycoside hydrolase family 73 protein [Mucilaginibacter sp.]
MPAPQAFAQTIAADAVHSCVNTGVFPSVVIAQAIEESGSGSSKLAKYNNLFGHKAGRTWLGRKIQMVAGGSFWRVYDSIAQAITAHTRILKNKAGVIKASTPFAQALALQKAGYNTGPDREQYAQKLARIIKSYNLQQYDTQLINIEKSINKNGLAFHQQSSLTKTLHQIFA